jgi:hypothetical protein
MEGSSDVNRGSDIQGGDAGVSGESGSSAPTPPPERTP